jgi:molecular chaperone GrpE
MLRSGESSAHGRKHEKTPEPEGKAAPVEELAPAVAAPEAGETETVESLREKWLLALADRENVRKRLTAQTRVSVQNERKAILLAFLDVLDNLERALASHEGESNDWVEGTRNIFQQTVKIFRDYDVEPLLCLNQPFDPELHEAVSRTHDPEKPDGVVLQVVQVGYRFRDGGLLRPARVVVNAKA